MKENTSAPDARRWRKSSYSQPNGGQCVELTPTLDAVRDSKNPTESRMSVNLTGLLDAVKADRLNR